MTLEEKIKLLRKLANDTICIKCEKCEDNDTFSLYCEGDFCIEAEDAIDLEDVVNKALKQAKYAIKEDIESVEEEIKKSQSYLNDLKFLLAELG